LYHVQKTYVQPLGVLYHILFWNGNPRLEGIVVINTGPDEVASAGGMDTNPLNSGTRRRTRRRIDAFLFMLVVQPSSYTSQGLML
jgi:hypothetical protein